MKNKADVIFDVIVIFFMVIVIIVSLYPVYYCLVQSFNNGLDSRVGGVYFFPRAFTLENFATVLKVDKIYMSFLVTVARAVIGTVTSVYFTAMVAYGLSKKDIMFRKVYMMLGIINMYFGAALIPYYFVLKSLGLLNNFLVFIIPSLLSFFNVMLFIANFRGIPAAVEEAAKIDGANEFYIFNKLIIPLSLPIVATIVLFSGVGHWNAWFDSAFFTNGGNLKTLQCVLRDIINYANNEQAIKQRLQFDTSAVTIEAIRYTTMVVAVAPITIVYPFLQKYFIKGMMLGALKA